MHVFIDLTRNLDNVFRVTAHLSLGIFAHEEHLVCEYLHCALDKADHSH